MKRLVIIIVLASGIVFSMSSCNSITSSNTVKPINSSQVTNQSTTKPINQTENGNTALNTTINSAETTNTNIRNSTIDSINNNNQNQTNKVWYGDWEIKKEAASGRVSEYGDDDVKRLIGKKIHYAADSVDFDTTELKSPYYYTTTISDKDFFSLNYVSFDMLGITSPTITEVQIYTDNELKNSWYCTGDEFFIKNNNTLIMYDGGVYFELDRID